LLQRAAAVVVGMAVRLVAQVARAVAAALIRHTLAARAQAAKVMLVVSAHQQLMAVVAVVAALVR